MKAAYQHPAGFVAECIVAMLGGFALKGVPGNTPYVDREMENACNFTDKAEKRVVIRWLNNNNKKK